MDVVYVHLLADYATPEGYFKRTRKTPAEIPRSIVLKYGLPSSAVIVNSRGERITAENDFSGTSAASLLALTREKILPYLEKMSKEGLLELKQAELVRDERQGKKVRKILLQDIEDAIAIRIAEEKKEKQIQEEQAATSAPGTPA